MAKLTPKVVKFKVDNLDIYETFKMTVAYLDLDMKKEEKNCLTNNKDLTVDVYALIRLSERHNLKIEVDFKGRTGLLYFTPKVFTIATVDEEIEKDNKKIDSNAEAMLKKIEKEKEDSSLDDGFDDL
jgi:hypothetical protein